MATQDDSGKSQHNDDAADSIQAPAEEGEQPGVSALESTSTAQNAKLVATEAADTTLPVFGAKKNNVRGVRKLSPARVAASLHKIRLARAGADENVPAVATASSATTQPAPLTPGGKSGKRQRKAKKDRLQGWDQWSKFHLWRRTRPLWGSILMFLGSLILLIFPVLLLPFAFLVNSLWVGILIGSLLMVMALAQLFVPSYSVLTGSIGIVLSLISFLTDNFGGLFIGMLLGIIGGALSVAWRPVKRSKLVATSSATMP